MKQGAIIAIWLTILTAGCAQAELPDKSATVQRPIAEVYEKHNEQLMAVPGVVGTAISLCEGKPCIKVYAVKRTAELSRGIPQLLDGYPVEIEETGVLRTMPQNH